MPASLTRDCFHHVLGSSAGCDGRDVVEHLLDEQALTAACAVADMRRQDHIVRGAERLVGGDRFDCEDIQADG
jgi:hypothetical protein